jgi:hypothetical protein
MECILPASERTVVVEDISSMECILSASNVEAAVSSVAKDSSVGKDRTLKLGAHVMKGIKLSVAAKDYSKEVSTVINDCPKLDAPIMKAKPSVKKNCPEEVSSAAKGCPKMDSPKEVSTVINDCPKLGAPIVEAKSSVEKKCPEMVSSAAKDCPKSDSPIAKDKWVPFKPTFQEPSDDMREVHEMTNENDNRRGDLMAKSPKLEGSRHVKDVRKNKSSEAIQEPFDARPEVLEMTKDKRRRSLPMKIPKDPFDDIAGRVKSTGFRFRHVKDVGKQQPAVGIQEPFDKKSEVLVMTRNERLTTKPSKKKGFSGVKHVEKKKSARAFERPSDKRSFSFDSEDTRDDIVVRIKSTASYISDLVSCAGSVRDDDDHKDEHPMLCYISDILGLGCEVKVYDTLNQTNRCETTSNDDDTRMSWNNIESRHGTLFSIAETNSVVESNIDDLYSI